VGVKRSNFRRSKQEIKILFTKKDPEDQNYCKLIMRSKLTVSKIVQETEEALGALGALGG
jgi:hypothetical protein